ncbi:MAG: hypothetical protein VYC80_02865, partial [Planctomycetota bacterium]|nr:hypothetical protein [Planctomycetota bacterium]
REIKRPLILWMGGLVLFLPLKKRHFVDLKTLILEHFLEKQKGGHLVSGKLHVPKKQAVSGGGGLGRRAQKTCIDSIIAVSASISTGYGDDLTALS